MKNPRGTRIIISMLLLIGIQLNLLFRMNSIHSTSFSSILFSTTMAVLVLSVTLIRLFRKPYTMHVSEFSLQIKNRNLKPEDIKEIRIQGYFKPLIGIIPTGKVFTPFDLCFHIDPDQEDKAIKELKEWAEEHGVTVFSNKMVRRWI
ncbi:hypothetical protein ACK8P5_10760 [Paenibacillus sp. EC2-1]|uniref:hypothetical protein n=1 Tax=Paenibacillus sp. EC2-1 TaxID=3388665 RepID=UPI003BEF2778